MNDPLLQDSTEQSFVSQRYDSERESDLNAFPPLSDQRRLVDFYLLGCFYLSISGD